MDDWLELCRKALDSDDVLSIAPRDEFAKMLNAYDALRAQLHADDQRAWEALGKPEGTHDTTNVQRLCAEVEHLRGIIDDIESESGHCHFLDDEEHEPPHLPDHVRDIVQARDAARADLREAMELLRAYRTAWHTKEEWVPLYERADALLAKHKETP